MGRDISYRISGNNRLWSDALNTAAVLVYSYLSVLQTPRSILVSKKSIPDNKVQKTKAILRGIRLDCDQGSLGNLLSTQNCSSARSFCCHLSSSQFLKPTSSFGTSEWGILRTWKCTSSGTLPFSRSSSDFVTYSRWILAID